MRKNTLRPKIFRLAGLAIGTLFINACVEQDEPEVTEGTATMLDAEESLGGPEDDHFSMDVPEAKDEGGALGQAASPREKTFEAPRADAQRDREKSEAKAQKKSKAAEPMEEALGSADHDSAYGNLGIVGSKSLSTGRPGGTYGRGGLPPARGKGGAGGIARKEAPPMSSHPAAEHRSAKPGYPHASQQRPYGLRADRFEHVEIIPDVAPRRPATGADMFFKDFGVNPTLETRSQPKSTFSIDVDTTSFAMMRNYLNRGALPPTSAVRVEEVINALDYDYQAPRDGVFSVHAEAFPSPNREGYHLLHIGIKGREVDDASRKPLNLVFVVDTSGSMGRENRIGLVKRSLRLLVDRMDGRDRIGIVEYGSRAQTVLSSTPVTNGNRRSILAGIERLQPNGSTNVQAGLAVGYDMAERNFNVRGVNRLVLCSDGVANTGNTSPEALLRQFAPSISRGVRLSAVGFGMGNYNDVLMEKLADAGNGNYAYIDDLGEARKLFVERFAGTMEVIAKDVKIQLDFNEEAVARYRLIGFENRVLANRDFANDRVDAGEIGAGHTVTAMYEVKLRDGHGLGNLAELRLRYKAPHGSTSRLVARSLPQSIVRTSFARGSAPSRLSFIAGAFGEKMRESYWVRNISYDHLLNLWGELPGRVRSQTQAQELRSMMLKAKNLDHRRDRFATILPIERMDFDRVPVLVARD